MSETWSRREDQAAGAEVGIKGEGLEAGPRDAESRTGERGGGGGGARDGDR